ncbi:MAG: pilus assembly protein [Alphaproteobacteria bacterium]|nr:pilus assembly protein [Alphaproteobacteria bacterium]
MLKFLSQLRVKEYRRPQKGSVAVEMAILAPVFFMMFFGIIELSLMLLTQHLMENATFNASRLGKTGFVETGQTQLETVKARLNTELSGLSPLIDMNKVVFSATSYGEINQIDIEGEGTSGLGTAQEIVVYSVSYPWSFFTPLIAQAMGSEDGTVLLTARLVVRNEPY